MSRLANVYTELAARLLDESPRRAKVVSKDGRVVGELKHADLVRAVSAAAEVREAVRADRKPRVRRCLACGLLAVVRAERLGGRPRLYCPPCRATRAKALTSAARAERRRRDPEGARAADKRSRARRAKERAALAKAYYAKHREKRRAEFDAWAKANAEALRQKRKAYYATNADEIRSNARAYNKREEVKERKAQWWRDNPEKAAECRARANAKRKAKRKADARLRAKRRFSV